jgi:hypothetical protein
LATSASTALVREPHDRGLAHTPVSVAGGDAGVAVLRGAGACDLRSETGAEKLGMQLVFFLTHGLRRPAHFSRWRLSFPDPRPYAAPDIFKILCGASYIALFGKRRMSRFHQMNPAALI